MEPNTVTQDGFPTLEQFNQQSGQDKDQMTLFSLQELAVRETDSITSLQDKIKNAKEMLDSAFEIDDVFMSAKNNSESANKQLKGVKQEISRRPEVISLDGKLKELKNELKEKKEMISSYAMEVYRQSGNNEFEKDGQVYEIKAAAKLVKRKQ